MAEGQNASGEFRESIPYLWSWNERVRSVATENPVEAVQRGGGRKNKKRERGWGRRRGFHKHRLRALLGGGGGVHTDGVTVHWVGPVPAGGATCRSGLSLP